MKTDVFLTLVVIRMLSVQISLEQFLLFYFLFGGRTSDTALSVIIALFGKYSKCLK